MNDFLIQMIRRFIAETPAFHKSLQWIFIITTVIAAVPQFMAASRLITILPDGVLDIVSKVVMISGVVGAFVSQLAVTETAKAMAAKMGKPIT